VLLHSLRLRQGVLTQQSQDRAPIQRNDVEYEFDVVCDLVSGAHDYVHTVFGIFREGKYLQILYSY
jgi:hypothetical protein